MTRRLWIGTLLTVAVFVASAWPTLPSMVDDAYVSLRYARNLALGAGLTYNAGQPPVEGYTDFLWVLWMAPGTRLPLHPSTWATGWGLAFGALGVVLANRAAAALCGRDSLWALLPGALLAPLPVYGIASTNGLETSMYVATLLAAGLALAERRPVATGVLAGLCYLVRPEGIAAGLTFAIAGAISLRGTRAGWWRPIGAFAAVVVPYFLARYAWFGTLGPNTFAAQAREGWLGMFAMNASYYRRSAGVLGGAAILWLASAILPPRTVPKLALLAVAAGLALVATRVYNWMPGARLFLPSVALVAVAVAPSLQALPRRAGAFAAVALIVGTALLSLGPSRAEETRYDAHNTALPGNDGERIGRAIAAAAPHGAWLLARDAGVVPYFAGPDVDVVDIHPFSLTDPALTGRPFDPDHVLARDPAFLVTTAMTEDALPTEYDIERRLLADPRVSGRFERVGTGRQHFRRWYALWAREDVAAAAADALDSG